MAEWKKIIISAAARFTDSSADNFISDSSAITRELAGLRIFQEPLIAYGSADDPLFSRLKDENIIGRHFILPDEWLHDAKTVISFFLPFSEQIRKSNKMNFSWPSDEWLHGRIEGQVFVNRLANHIRGMLIKAGYQSLVPSVDSRFTASTGDPSKSAYKQTGAGVPPFSSNWSERHAAFICGLGTFGLSKGLITGKGIAGRFGSIITELQLEPDQRNYSEIYEYCTMCGACVKNCPAGAISLEKGKDHYLCSKFLDRTMKEHHPRYGCGKCQVGVPCEGRIPVKKNL